MIEAAPTATHRHGTHGTHGTHGSHRHRSRRRRWVLGGVLVGVLALLLGGALLATFRYLPAVDDAKALRADLERVVDRARTAGLGMSRPDLEAMQADLATARTRFTNLDALLAGDPLVAVARALPPSGEMVAGADGVTAAGGQLLDAADAAMVLAGRYVSIRERQATAGGKGSALAELTELMATGGGDVDRMLAAVDRANALLAATPATLPGPIAQVRDALRTRTAQYGPLLRGYAEADGVLPAILGWDRPRRYLVLTQNPAELRPTGGFIGSFGTITFDKGRITDKQFQDVFLLDLPWDYPFVKAPDALRRYLLGPKQPWQLADANWSPDFPTSAQEAVTLYANEGGPGQIDGVIGITTQTIDELLALTGPITVPEYGVTIAAGETTLKVLQNTRVARDPAENRKAFLSTFANQLFDTLLGLPPGQWTALAGRAEVLKSERLLLAWFKEPTLQAEVAQLGFDGAVRQDPGDYVYPVDSNVMPASKLNAVTDRALEVSVRLDELGNASNELRVTWTNNIETPAAKPYRELPQLEDLRVMGMYFRLLVPERSRLEGVDAGTTQALHSAADVGDEAGRTVIANYFRIPAGTAHLRYRWTSPYPADLGEDGVFTYRITIQKQPGLRPGPLRLEITLPPRALLLDASPGLTGSGGFLGATTTFDRDIVAVVRYRLPAAP